MCLAQIKRPSLSLSSFIFIDLQPKIVGAPFLYRAGAVPCALLSKKRHFGHVPVTCGPLALDFDLPNTILVAKFGCEVPF